jgi:peptide/nickel transport system substrate-binding protein
MRNAIRPTIAILAIAVLAAGCAPAPARNAATAPQPVSESPAQNRVLTVAVRYEPRLLPKIQTAAAESVQRWFNAALTLTDEHGSVRPMIADVPQLNTESWRVFPDGRMETTYRLRPGITWHDGTPLSAEDFVFAWRVYTHPSLDAFTRSPQHLMDDVAAPDPQTLVIQWRSPFPDANAIRAGDLDPLPRHILEQTFAGVQRDAGGADAFMGLPYWTSEYVGVGPYRLLHWEPGTQYEGVAFDGYVLGRPKIGRILLRVILDENTTLTNFLAGSVDLSGGATMRFEQAQVLLRDWVPAGKGHVILNQSGVVTQNVQMRPEYVGHPALLDVRVRRALAHSLDRQAINDGVFDGQGFPTETIVPASEPFFAEVDRAVVKHPYDLRRAEQLMTDAGFTKDSAGLYANGLGRYTLDFVTVAGSEFERTQLILTDAWRRAGIEVHPSVISAALVRDGQHRHTFPGLATKGGYQMERNFTAAEVGSAENRWTGDNRSGWVNPEYDRLYEAFLTTLDRVERTRQFVAMQRIVSEELPAYFTHHAVAVTAYAAALRGPKALPQGTGTFSKGAYENIHEWSWQ